MSRTQKFEADDDDPLDPLDRDGVLKDKRAARVPMMLRDSASDRPGGAFAYRRSDALARDREGYAESDIGSSCMISGAHFGSKYFGAEGRVAPVGDEILCVPLELLTEDQTMTRDVRMLLKDGNGNDVAGHRPGYVVSRNEAQHMNDRAAKIRALEAYEAELVDSWRHPINQPEVADEEKDLATGDAACHAQRGTPRKMADCYLDYDEKISELWKGNK